MDNLTAFSIQSSKIRNIKLFSRTPRFFPKSKGVINLNFKKFTGTLFIVAFAIGTVSCAVSHPGKRAPGAATHQGSGTYHVTAGGAGQVTRGQALEAFHATAQQKQEVGTYRSELEVKQAHHARHASGAVMPYAADPISALGLIGANLVTSSTAKPSTFSASGFTFRQSPLPLEAGSSLQIRIVKSPELISATDPATLAKVQEIFVKATRELGLKPVKSSTTQILVGLVRGSADDGYLSANLRATKRGGTREGFILLKKGEGSTISPESLMEVKKALGNLFAIR